MSPVSPIFHIASTVNRYVDGALGTNTTDWSYEGIAGNQLGRAIGEYP